MNYNAITAVADIIAYGNPGCNVENPTQALRMRSYTCNKLLRSAGQRHVSTQDKFCSRLLSTSIVDKISQNTPCTASQPLNLNVSMIYSAVLPPKLPELTYVLV